MYLVKNENSDRNFFPMSGGGTTQNFLNQSQSVQANSNISYQSIKNTDNSFSSKRANINFNSFNKNQSPKMKTGILREVEINKKSNNTFNNNNILSYLNEQNSNFSMLDVPLKNIVRGTNLPIQFKKLTPEEIDELYTTKNCHNTNSEKIDKKENDTKKVSDLDENFPGLDQNKILKEEIEHLSKLKSDVNKKKIERKIHTAKPFENRLHLKNLNFQHKEGVASKSTITSDKQDSDPWMPVEYRNYERNIKTAHAQRLHDPTSREIKNKMTDSNIFLTKSSTNHSSQNYLVDNFKHGRAANSNSNTNKKDYWGSDIFMTKNNTGVNTSRAEISKNKEIIYNVSTRSNSEWNDKISHPSLFNHTSVKYHILNPGIKHIFKTKEEIKESTAFNPVHRQKSLCEYRDLTRVGQPNMNREYYSALEKSPEIFRRTSNVCANFLDIHRSYKDLIEHPFKK
jgi:hypothetical protein